MSDETPFDGFLDDYFAESEEHLSGARAALLELESAGDRPVNQRRIVDDLFRFYHSLKGISAMVALRPAEQLAHELESYLRSIRAGDTPVTADGITLLLEGTSHLERIVNMRRANQPLPDIDAIVERIGVATRARPAPVAPADLGVLPGECSRWKCTFAPARELLQAGVGVDTIRKRLAEVGTLVQATPIVMPDASIVFHFILEAAADVDVKGVLADLPVTVEPAAETLAVERDRDLSAIEPAPTSQVVRVDLARLDELMRHVGDLVISRARLLDSLSRIEPRVPATEWRAVQDNAAAIDRQLRTLREGVMRVRLVPVGEIFRRMPFVVRDLSRESGKRVSLLVHGQATEIDKYVIERMMDPVLHLVRNAVSHGIESPEARIACGKRPEGTVSLTASTVGETVTIDISDDGRGVDTDAVLARAREAGLPIPPAPVDTTSILALLCSPGFSTKDAADRASGRGVGMAVVKDTVERLSGTIALDTTPGVGTRFTIQLPLTLAIADALIGRIGSESFAVPQNVVREAIEVQASDVHQIEENELVPYRGGSLAIVRLARLFGIDAEPLARFHVFVVGTGAGAVGFAVDRIIGQREIVVRTMADPLVRVDGISGATDLGDGRVVLILDPSALARAIRQRAPRVVTATTSWGRLRA